MAKRCIKAKLYPDLVCGEHGAYDVFPCAVPGCREGIEEDEFVAQGFNSGKDDLMRRVTWISPIDGKYYTWKGYLPHWFSIDKAVSNELRRLRIVSNESRRRVYHYTDINGFMGIVKSGCLWLSDYPYMNDSSEVMHGLGVVRQALAGEMAAIEDADIRRFLQTLDLAVVKPARRVCVASFSEDGDSLGHWRGYGPIALGFDSGHIMFAAYGAELKRVEYDAGRQAQRARVYVAHMAQSYARDVGDDKHQVMEASYMNSSRLVSVAAFFKYSAFASERECRLVYVEDAYVNWSLKMPNAAKEFRAQGSRIVPYIRSNNLGGGGAGGGKLEIEEVVLGPAADDMLESGVREFLDANKMAETRVRRSVIPFRG